MGNAGSEMTDNQQPMTVTTSRTVEIDAGDLSFADSAGLRALLSARETAEQQGVVLRLGPISPALGRLLDMTGLREVFEIPTA